MVSPRLSLVLFHWHYDTILCLLTALSLSDITITNSDMIADTKQSVTGLASVPAIKQYLRAAEQYDIDTPSLLVQAGIDPDDLTDNRRHVSNLAFEKLIGLLVRACGDLCLGLHSSAYIEASTYSVLGYMAMNSATPREMLAQVPIYEKIVGDMGISSTELMGDYVLQRWQCQFSNPVAVRQEVEAVISSWYAFTNTFIKEVDVTFFECIWFEHAPPEDPALLQDYRTHFECDVLFNQRANGIIIRESKMDLPLSQANPLLLQTLLDHATELLANMNYHQSVTNQVKNLLRLMLKERPPSSALIAERLGISERTLQRKLNEEGCNYKEVLNELRLELALHYLNNTSLNLDEISIRLGYSEPRSFYRSFKLWTGRTAGSYRND